MVNEQELTGDTSTIVGVYIDDATKQLLKRAAKEDNRSLSSFMVYAAVKYTKEKYKGNGNVFN